MTLRYRIASVAAAFFATMVAAPAASAQSAFAGEQHRAIKSLSEKEIDDLREGRGVGLARAGELNRYPGPMHVLDLAVQMNVTAEQRAEIETSMAAMRMSAKKLGAEIIALEGRLDGAFAGRMIDASSLEELTRMIGEKQGALRATHLAAHLETTAILTPAQIAHYDALRGYAAGSANSPAPSHGQGAGHQGVK